MEMMEARGLEILNKLSVRQLEGLGDHLRRLILQEETVRWMEAKVFRFLDPWTTLSTHYLDVQQFMNLFHLIDRSLVTEGIILLFRPLLERHDLSPVEIADALCINLSGLHERGILTVTSPNRFAMFLKGYEKFKKNRKALDEKKNKMIKIKDEPIYRTH